MIGCNTERRPAVNASATVTVRGKPLTGAIATLQPIGGTKGPNASVPIFGGHFDLGPEAKLIGGTYRVRFTMMPAGLRSEIPEDAGYEMPPDNAVIDPDFGRDSRLTWTLVDGQPNEQAFQIKFLKR